MFRIIALLSILFSSAAAAQDAPKLVKLFDVVAVQSSVQRQFFGHVAAKETVDLAFQVGGQVVDIPIIEGQPVPKGGAIATLDLEPFQLALDQARVQKDQADRTLDRLKQLQGGAVSRVSVDDAETQAKLAEISVRNAERSLQDAQLTAPFDALVASRFVANFSTIGAGTPVARLHDLSELRVEINVPEVLFQQAGENPDVELLAKFPASDTLFPLEAREFNAETSQVGQTFSITLGMAPPLGMVILPGSSVTVLATLKDQAPAIFVPRSAILAANDGSTQVMLFSADTPDEGTVSLKPVSIAPSSNGFFMVTEGLEPGQEIVASGVNLLSNGDRVKRFTGFSN
jgi:RND family efflux transporter MFP subunit